MSKDVFLTLNRNRRLVYAFLSRMYEKEITTDLLKELSGENSPITQFMVSDDEELRRGLETLSEYLKDLKERDLEQARLELAVEYANLFLGVKGKVWHPSESSYRSKGHLTMQEPMDKVLHAYWEAGVDKEQKFTEPADHIAVEFQFMAYLCRKTAEALEENRKAEAKEYYKMQKDFLKKHLSQWVYPFTKDVREAAEVGFYKGVAIITKRFVELDDAMIDDLLREIEGL